MTITLYQQTKVKKVNTFKVMLERGFIQGYEDATKGRPWRDFDKFVQTNSMWRYERARCFVAWIKSEGYEVPPLFIRVGVRKKLITAEARILMRAYRQTGLMI